MARRRDAIDLLMESWARVRRQLLGIHKPLTAREYLGSPRCTLASRRDLHAGARSEGRIEQHWPEFPFTGDLFIVNWAVKRMPDDLRQICDWHWTLEQPRDRRQRAELMGISKTVYWERVGRAKDRVAGVLDGSQMTGHKVQIAVVYSPQFEVASAGPANTSPAVSTRRP